MEYSLRLQLTIILMDFSLVYVYIEVTLLSFSLSESTLVCFTPNLSLIFDLFLLFYPLCVCVCCIAIKISITTVSKVGNHS